MTLTGRNRRFLALLLIGVGSLPLTFALVVVASMLFAPGFFRCTLDVFTPAGIDAPDTWAIAFTRLAHVFLVFLLIGAVSIVAGVWLSRRSVAV
jgi:hypothetical protein